MTVSSTAAAADPPSQVPLKTLNPETSASAIELTKLPGPGTKAKKRGWTPEQVYQEYVDEMALRRVTVSRDIANAALFLASDESSNMTGQSMTVDGGWDV